MGHKWTWQQLQAEQDKRIQDAMSDSAASSWPAIRKLIEQADEILPGTMTIWEGPGRAATYPISYQAVTDFIKRFDDAAKRVLGENVTDQSPVVAGHCLMGLSWCDSPLLSEAASRCRDRLEQIHSIYGSFGWEGSLAEYAVRLTNEDSEPDTGGNR